VGAHFGGDGRGEERIILDVLDFVGLKGKERIEAKRLCLFDKKLTMLAAALATQPRLLMLDEPVGGLSPTEIQHSISLFKRINRDLGITLVVIEHLMSVLTGISDRLMILHNGEKISIGPPEEVVRNREVIDIYLGEEHA
jgi:branched-chain amino acid transport system ATP-binding protein